VFGVDRCPIGFSHPKFQASMLDIRDAARLSEALRSIDAVVHLAFWMTDEQRSGAAMRGNNIDGTFALFAAARRCGVAKVINLSSVSVYGAGDSLTEAAPLAPSPHFPYAGYKAEIERRAASEYPEVVHLRPHFILGRNAQAFSLRFCNSRLFIALSRPQWRRRSSVRSTGR
jgi:nucleoside-diphosphate-sugar epimerase